MNRKRNEEIFNAAFSTDAEIVATIKYTASENKTTCVCQKVVGSELVIVCLLDTLVYNLAKTRYGEYDVSAVRGNVADVILGVLCFAAQNAQQTNETK